MKNVVIKITKAGPNTGPFNISTEFGDIVATDISKLTLIQGITVEVKDDVSVIILESVGICSFKKSFSLESYTIIDYVNAEYSEAKTSCMWRHLDNTTNYNNFYGNIEPYIIEYPFAFEFQDEILQNVKDYTKAYEYIPSSIGAFNDSAKIEVDDKWFNESIIYNSQQNSGLLKLVPKPINNLQAYGQYPIYQTDSKIITYTKSDNFYQYNNFWNVQKHSNIPGFITSCENLSLDKQLNQGNMDYSTRSFKKGTIRGKDLKIRHILNDRSNIHLVSQFILNSSQISYK